MSQTVICESIKLEYQCTSGETILIYETQHMTSDLTKQFCSRNNGTLLNLDDTTLIEPYFSSCVAKCITIQLDNGQLLIKHVVDCYAKTASPICKVPAPVTSSSYRLCDKKDDWVPYNNSYFCMSNQLLSYTNAISHCNKVNSELGEFTTAADSILLGLLGRKNQFSLTTNHDFWARVMGRRASLTNPLIPPKTTILHSTGVSAYSGSLIVASAPTHIGPPGVASVPVPQLQVRPPVMATRLVAQSNVGLANISPTRVAPLTMTSPTPIIPSVVSTLTRYRSVPSTGMSSTLSRIATVSSSNGTTDVIGPIWTTIGQSEYIVVRKGTDYASAFECCQRMYDATLIEFMDPIGYFKVFSDLRITEDSYWIVAQTNTTASVNRCVVFHGNNRTMSTLPCGDKLFSVCKRSIYGNDTDQPLHHPQFIQLLKEMTVVKSETVVNKRKLISAEDHRTSAKTTGSLGIVFMCVLISVMVLMDLSHLKK
ncbi:hypothetical protein ACF0H5_014631 [Mactra antiquata]